MAIIAEQGSRRRAAKKSKKITIRSKAIDDFDRPEITLRFNALNHELVPHQELVGAANISEEEQFEVESKELKTDTGGEGVVSRRHAGWCCGAGEI